VPENPETQKCSRRGQNTLKKVFFGQKRVFRVVNVVKIVSFQSRRSARGDFAAREEILKCAKGNCGAEADLITSIQNLLEYLVVISHELENIEACGFCAGNVGCEIVDE